MDRGESTSPTRSSPSGNENGQGSGTPSGSSGSASSTNNNSSSGSNEAGREADTSAGNGNGSRATAAAAAASSTTNTSSPLPAPTPSLTSTTTRDELNLFERFMDVFTGNRSTNPNSGSSAAPPPVTGGGASLSSLVEPHNHTGGAIIITVSYVFSDENNPQSPNRSGSLVMSLPNTPANRDPTTIQEIVALATQMAYSTIVSGFKKSVGTTIEKFNSFPQISLESLTETKTCPICFEDYEEVSEEESTVPAKDEKEDKEEGGPRKKRKVALEDGSVISSSSGTSGSGCTTSRSGAPNSGNSSSGSTSTSSTSQEADSDRVRRRRRRSEGETVASNDSSFTFGAEADSSQDAPAQPPKLLSECTETYKHCPVKMPCGHIFGQVCLFEWLKDHTTCPLCRDSVSEEQQTIPVAPQQAAAVGGDTAGNPSVSTSTSSSFTNILNHHRAPPPRASRGNNFASSSTSLYRIDPLGAVRHTPPGLGAGTPRGASTGPILGMGGGAAAAPLRRSLRTNGSSATSSPTAEGGDNGVLSQLFAFLRRPPSQPPSQNLFPTGVSSRRTANGVITRQTGDSNTNEILDFLNLRSLTDDPPSSSAQRNTDTNTTTNTNNTNNNANANDNDNESNDVRGRGSGSGNTN